jgi:hypothetical protein
MTIFPSNKHVFCRSTQGGCRVNMSSPMPNLEYMEDKMGYEEEFINFTDNPLEHEVV